MQGWWLDFRALALSVAATPEASLSSSPWRVRNGSNPSSVPSAGPDSGKVALRSGMAAVLHAAGTFLRMLRHDRGSRDETRDGLEVVNGVVARRVRASLFLSRISSVLRKFKCHDAMVPTMNAALLPPSSVALSQQGLDAAFDVGLCDGAIVGLHGCPSPAIVVEPKTGLEFPTQLSGDHVDERVGDASPSCQILAGVGARSKEIMKFKSIKIYAFGLYVRPDHLHDQLGDKYKGFTAGDLKDRPDFLDDLLRRHEVEMTLRLVVHYKGLKIGMVRTAFQDSLRNRLNKIKGGGNDEGLQTFCSYLSDDIRLRQGSTIDIRWQRGGRLQTEIEGRRVGVIHSPSLCQAFFDLYIGDPPVSAIAKQEIGASFARILGERSR